MTKFSIQIVYNGDVLANVVYVLIKRGFANHWKWHFSELLNSSHIVASRASLYGAN